MSSKTAGVGRTERCCIVVHPRLRGASRDPSARLAEASGLAAAVGLEVVHAEAISLASAKPATLFGAGSVARLGDLVAERADSDKIEVVIVDGTLGPVQQRNLERAWKTKVIDRTGLILEIFGERARTREGVLQVELAALVYARSRLVRSWTHLERQRGGLGFVGGPGETQIEADRRMISERIAKLRKDVERVRATRARHRAARRRVPFPVVALVGYTNAGKSTLFNRLTQSAVDARDQVFATLDPTMRGVDLPSGRRVILSDTVGFISDLPHELVAAFHATLEEVREADLVLHVRDAAHPDRETQRADVLSVLRDDLGMDSAEEEAIVEVLNKTDMMAEEELTPLVKRSRRSNGRTAPVSALTGDGCAALLELVDARLAAGRTEMTVRLSPADGASLAWLYRHGEVTERRDGETEIELVVRLSPADVGRFERMTAR